MKHLNIETIIENDKTAAAITLITTQLKLLGADNVKVIVEESKE